MVYRPKIDEKLCFVLMPFGAPFDGYYEHVIKRAVGNAGLAALRADEIYGIKPIIRDIWEAIWRARLIIADVTDRNPNVNYELGMCHSLGVPTILIAKRMEDVPFDYRHRRCIIYDTEEALWEHHLAEAIEKTIAATLAQIEVDTELPWPYDTGSIAQTGGADSTISIDNPREIVLRGVAELERLIEKAYGPLGATVLVSTTAHGALPQRRGLDIANGIRSANVLEDNGIEQMRQMARLVLAAVGDCTKTAILLFHAMLLRGHAAISQGHATEDLLRGMERATQTAVSSLAAQSQPTKGDALLKVALSASGDLRIASAVVEAMNKVGQDGVITIESGNVTEPNLSLAEGMRFDRGYLSDRFATDPETQQSDLENCRLLIYDRRISSMKEILPLLERVARTGAPLLIIAEDVEGEALATLVVNNIRGTLRCAAVRAPGTGDRRTAALQDIAILTGGRAITADIGLSLADADLSDLGTADRVTVTKEETTILGGRGEPATVELHVNYLRTAIARAWDSFDREKLQERLTNFAGRIAAIRVGGSTPHDAEDQRYRAESVAYGAIVG